jgi:hypothetical protein
VAGPTATHQHALLERVVDEQIIRLHAQVFPAGPDSPGVLLDKEGMERLKLLLQVTKMMEEKRAARHDIRRRQRGTSNMRRADLEKALRAEPQEPEE